MTSDRRTGETASNLREALLERASALFAANGYDRTSIRDIGDQLGVNPAIVARHFGTKEDLFRESVGLGVDTREMLGALAPGEVEALARLFLRWLDDSQRHNQALMLLRSIGSPETHDLMRDLLTQSFIDPLAAQLADTCTPRRARRRAAAMVAVLIGVALLRDVLELEDLSDMKSAALADLLGPALRALSGRV